MFYKVKTSKIVEIITARDLREAIGKFFKDIKSGNITVDMLDVLVYIENMETKENIVLRTIPTLYNLQVICWNDAVTNFMRIGLNRNDAKDKLKELVIKDYWIINEIDKLC